MLDIKYCQKLNIVQLQFYHGNGITELKIEVKTMNRKLITFFRLLRCFRLKNHNKRIHLGFYARGRSPRHT